MFEVSAQRLRYTGPPAAALATTGGDELSGVYDLQASLVKGDMTTIKLEWQAPKDKRKLKWEYGIYYGANLKVNCVKRVHFLLLGYIFINFFFSRRCIRMACVTGLRIFFSLSRTWKRKPWTNLTCLCYAIT